MKLVLKDGTIKEVDTSFIMNNQYIDVDGKRIPDTSVQRIIDDVRLGEFYCSSVKQGTYDEVAEAIKAERSKINQCKGCFWFSGHTRIKDECEKKVTWEGNKRIINERTVYEISCAYKPEHNGKCVHDIDEEPVLFREKNFCFFCEYPNGVPDQMAFRKFMIDNAEKYGIVPYWSDQKLSIDNTFKHNKKFGSYTFEASHFSKYFTIENSRSCFRFYIDFANKKFILDGCIDYEVVNYLGTSEYDYKTRTSKYVPIKNYDQFAKWIWGIADDFLSQDKMTNEE